MEVAAAVEGLHSAPPPVVHVDIAARNVLVDGEGGRTSWLANSDFGLARPVGRR